MATLKASYFTIFEPEIWSPFISVYFKKKLGAAKFFRDFSEEFRSGGDRTSIPTVGDSFIATAITQTTGDVSTRIISDTAVVLTINKWYGDGLLIADFQKAQISASYNMQRIYAEAMADRAARRLDTDLLALGTNINPKVGDSATDVRVSTIEAAMAKADSYSLPHEDLIIFLHPTTYIKMRLLWETIRCKFRKFGGTLKSYFETIPSQAQLFWEGVTTKDGTPQMAMI